MAFERGQWDHRPPQRSTGVATRATYDLSRGQWSTETKLSAAAAGVTLADVPLRDRVGAEMAIIRESGEFDGFGIVRS